MKNKMKYFGLGVTAGLGLAGLVVTIWAWLGCLTCDDLSFRMRPYFNPMNMEQLESRIDAQNNPGMGNRLSHFTVEAVPDRTNGRELQIRATNHMNHTLSLNIDSVFAGSVYRGYRTFLIWKLDGNDWVNFYTPAVGEGALTRLEGIHLIEPYGYVDMTIDLREHFGHLCRGEYVIQVGWAFNVFEHPQEVTTTTFHMRASHMIRFSVR